MMGPWDFAITFHLFGSCSYKFKVFFFSPKLANAMPGPLSCAALAEMPELVFKITVGYLCDTWEPLENRIVLSFVSSGSLIKEGRWHVVFQSWNVKEAGSLLFPSQKVHLFFLWKQFGLSPFISRCVLSLQCSRCSQALSRPSSCLSVKIGDFLQIIEPGQEENSGSLSSQPDPPPQRGSVVMTLSFPRQPRVLREQDVGRAGAQSQGVGDGRVKWLACSHEGWCGLPWIWD